MSRDDDLSTLLTRVDPVADLSLSGPEDQYGVRDRIMQMPRATAAATVPPRGSGAMRRVALATVAVVAAALVLLPGLPGSNSGAFAVKPLDDGRLEIDLLAAASTDAEQVAEELREHGVSVTFDPLTGPPDMVGEILGFSGSHVTLRSESWPPPGLEFVDGPQADSTTLFIDPSVFRGALDIQVAVPLPAGQEYEYVDSAFLPGAPLEGVACAIGDPMSVESLLPHLRERGLDARWRIINHAEEHSDGGHTYGTPAEPTPVAPQTGQVITAEALSPDLIEVTVLPDDLVAPFITSYIDDFPCDGTGGQPMRADVAG